MTNDQNKKIGLIIADNNEIHKFNEFQFIKKHNLKFNVNEYNFHNIRIFAIHSGIGLVNAAMVSQYLIDQFNVCQVWNYGAVGSSNKLNIYDVIIPTKFYYYDVITPWYKRGVVPGEKEYYINSLNKFNFSKEEINIASGNSFLTDVNAINEIKKEINVELFDMESCSIAQVCSKNNIPFYCVKSISDIIGNNNKIKEDINNIIHKSSELAFKKLISLILEINIK
ncbi:MAG: hypothetical protein HDR43_01285 [Mycoplasma sp.]|nr:hypothetical protein [Mycoplasma sp.]